MVWCEGKILQESDFEQKPEPSETNFQFGDYVWIRFIDAMRSVTKFADVPGRIAGIHIRRGNQVHYDVAVPIAGTPYYALVENLQGQIVARTQPNLSQPGQTKLELVK